MLRLPIEHEVMSTTPYILGIDIGATKIAAAAFDMNHRRLSDVQSIPTMAKHPAPLTLMNLKRAAAQAGQAAGVKGPPLAVGMGSPGPLDAAGGRLLETDTLPNLMGFHMARFVEQEIGAPLHLENDANCFALAAALVGEGKGCEVVVGVTLGTGFGCGIVMSGKIYSGVSGNAGEVAYCRVAGGTFDEMLTGSGVKRFYERITSKEAPEPKKLGEMAKAGDQEAIKTWAVFGEAVGEALGMIAAVVDPSVIVLGGSVARRFDLFRESMERTLKERLAPNSAERIEVKRSELDHMAGVTGAAEYAFQRLSEAER